MSKTKPLTPPPDAAGKGGMTAPGGRRYDGEKHEWVDEAPAAPADPQPTPAGEKE